MSNHFENLIHNAITCAVLFATTFAFLVVGIITLITIDLYTGIALLVLMVIAFVLAILFMCYTVKSCKIFMKDLEELKKL